MRSRQIRVSKREVLTHLPSKFFCWVVPIMPRSNRRNQLGFVRNSLAQLIVPTTAKSLHDGLSSTPTTRGFAGILSVARPTQALLFAQLFTGVLLASSNAWMPFCGSGNRNKDNLRSWIFAVS